jgi:ribose-phosphate pyrophosphokinase
VNRATDLALFALGSSHDFGARVAARLRVALAAHEARDFEDGEHKLRPLESVRERDCYVLHALYGEPAESPNDKLVKTLFFAGTLQDAGAARVTVIAPYLCYARKDRRTKTRDPVTCRYVAQMLESVGVTRVLTIDVHNVAAYQNAFRIPAEHLEAAPLLASELVRECRDRPVVVVSPDAGGMKRADAVRERLEHRLGRPVERALMEKRRSAGVVSGDYLAGEVAGSTALIVDDLISTGTTLHRAARACRAHGAERVFAAVTHGLFAAGANTVLRDMPIDGLFVTDTVPPFRLDPPLHDRLRVLSVVPLFAAAIERLHTGGSLVELMA